MNYSALAGLVAFLASPAIGASPVSTAISCTEVKPKKLVVPVADAAVIFNCTVKPAKWRGTVALSGGAPFTTTVPSANKFSVVLSRAVTVPGTYLPGTIRSTP